MSKTTATAEPLQQLAQEFSGESATRWSLPPIECEPWCRYGDGHPDMISSQDQVCYSDALRVDLTLHDPVAESYCLDGRWIPGPDYVEVGAQQAADARAAHITLIRECDDAPTVEWKFRPDEARQLIENLQLVLGQIESPR